MSQRRRAEQETRKRRAVKSFSSPELRDGYMGRLAAGDDVEPLFDSSGQVMGYRAFESGAAATSVVFSEHLEMSPALLEWAREVDSAPEGRAGK